MREAGREAGQKRAHYALKESPGFPCVGGFKFCPRNRLALLAQTACKALAFGGAESSPLSGEKAFKSPFAVIFGSHDRPRPIPRISRACAPIVRHLIIYFFALASHEGLRLFFCGGVLCTRQFNDLPRGRIYFV